MSPLRWVLMLVPLCLLSVGCSTYNLEQPTATLRGAELGGVNAEGITMNFLVDVQNPNGVHLPLRNVNYNLDVGGVGVLRQKAELDAGVPANGTAAVNVPVTLRFEDLLKAERAIVRSGGDIPYSFDGSLGFTGGGLLGGADVPLRYSGTLPLGQILRDPQILLQNPAARQLAQRVLGGVMGL